MRRRTKIIIGIVVLIIAGVLTAGFVSRRGKDITPVTYGKVARQDLTSKVSANGRIAGAYVHGLFANDSQRAAWLATLGVSSELSYEATIERTLVMVQAEVADRLERMRPVIRLDPADNDVTAATPQVAALSQHRVGFADTRRIADIHA